MLPSPLATQPRLLSLSVPGTPQVPGVGSAAAALAAVGNCDKGLGAWLYSAFCQLLLDVWVLVTVFGYLSMSENKTKIPALGKLVFSKDKQKKQVM